MFNQRTSSEFALAVSIPCIPASKRAITLAIAKLESSLDDDSEIVIIIPSENWDSDTIEFELSCELSTLKIMLISAFCNEHRIAQYFSINEILF